MLWGLRSLFEQYYLDCLSQASYLVGDENQHGTLCAWGPRLDAAGNSVAAIAALDEFTTASGLSVF